MNFVSKYVSPFLKAHLAGVGAGLSLLLADLNAGGAMSASQWYAIVGAVIGVGAVVAVVPNTVPAPVVAAPTPVALVAQDDIPAVPAA